MRSIAIFLSIIISYQFLFSQTITKENAGEFLYFLCNDSNDLSPYVNPEELNISLRLGIEYKEINNKFLIGSELSDNIKPAILSNSEILVEEINTGENYSELSIIFPVQNYNLKYYLKDGKLISSVLYHSRNWSVNTTKYIKFIIQDENLINEYAMKKLNDYVEDLCLLLEIGGEEKELLESEKVYYYLCSDQHEIEKLTGYKSLGMCNFAYDYIISTYNAHFHELSHLLINFKLKKTNLYTHPFLQEGFAVSQGGRGGLSVNVMLRTGAYILNNFISHGEYLETEDFIKEDPSFTYPVSGIYNRFLISRFGIKKYLSLYRDYSYPLNNPKHRLNTEYLPDSTEFMNFKDSIKKNILIKPLKDEDDEVKYFNGKLINGNPYFVIYDEDYYIFRVSSSFVIYTDGVFESYISKKFNEKISGKNYKGSKYLIYIDSDEISVYNLYINTLLANYSINFENDIAGITKLGGYYFIKINKFLFENNDKDFIIETLY